MSGKPGAERRQVRLGLVGFGEVGSGLGKGLRGEGLASVVAYDVAAFEGPFAPLIQRRAREAGVALVASPAELAARADVIVAVVPGSECVVAARAYSAHLEPRHLYVDIASATPRVKEAVGAVLAATGARVGDGGIMGSPLMDGHRILIKGSGPAAQAFHDAMTPWGMRYDVVSDKLGAGSAIKIVRSVVMKGLEALLVECAVASERYGIHDEVFASLAEFLEARPYSESAAFLLRTGVIHAERRAEEARMSCAALEEVGLEPLMTRATAEQLQRVADMRLKEHFNGEVPGDYKVAVDAVVRRLAAAS